MYVGLDLAPTVISYKRELFRWICLQLFSFRDTLEIQSLSVITDAGYLSLNPNITISGKDNSNFDNDFKETIYYVSFSYSLKKKLFNFTKEKNGTTNVLGKQNSILLICAFLKGACQPALFVINLDGS